MSLSLNQRIINLESGSGGWSSDYLFIARNTNVNNMGSDTTYYVGLGEIVKSSPHISINSGSISVDEDGWYRVRYTGIVEQSRTADYGFRMSIRMGFFCIQDNAVDDNIFWSDTYLRGNTGTAQNDLTRYGYINNSGYTFLFSNKTYRLIVQGALGGGNFDTSLSGVILRNANLQIEKMV